MSEHRAPEDHAAGVPGGAVKHRIERADADGLCRSATYGARLFGLASRIERVAGACVCLTGAGQLVNRVLGLGLDGPVEDAMLAVIEHMFETAGLDPQFEVWPGLDPALEARLEGRGYRLSGRLQVLAAVGSGIGVAPGIPRGIVVERVRPATAMTYELTVSRGFAGLDHGDPSDAERLFARAAARSPHAEAWLARIDDEPAGGGAASFEGGIGALYGASTLPRFRRRGIQSALLGARLRRAREAGCGVVFMKAAPGSGSERNAKRAGLTPLMEKSIWTRGARSVVG